MSYQGPIRKRYVLEFTNLQWEEVNQLAAFLAESDAAIGLTRFQWYAIGYMALGKAVRLESENNDGADDLLETVNDCLDQASLLRKVAAVIF